MLPPVFGCTISIHALREEGDPGNVPCRRWRSIYFYPRPPRGGRPSALVRRLPPSDFYPRPPRGGRPEVQKGVNIVFEFLSTPSARRATCSGRRPRPAWTDFYPRPPRGGRHGVCAARHDSLLFLSTPSARRATQHSRFCYVVIQFLSTPSARRAT